MSIFDKFREISKSEAPMPSGPVEYIIAGLGNPGEQYAYTRHNAGFMVMDTMAQRLGTEIKKLKFKSLCSDVSISGKHCLLMKPSTYMNNSGQAITEAMNFYKLDIEHVIIVYDDISLEPGTLRIRRKGSDGGHNGIKSIIYLTGENTFPRIKMGVGKKPHPKFDLADWVLSRFGQEDLEKMQDACQHACDSIELMVDGKIDEAMNKFNS
ncbi:aminoacyl-tRNA hydrolase [Porcipelethomonas sp.]|uniref:aminoacyl-tRNA hydrolase n=1 Tax=Porcipelethomonas sp. TaxID=2981675 RepID=UPI003EF2A0A2